MNNIKIYPINKNITNIINNNKNKKKSKSRKEKAKGKETKPKKSKINSLIQRINRISIDKTEEKKERIDNIKIPEIKYNDNPIEEYEEEIMNNLFHEEMKNRPIK